MSILKIATYSLDSRWFTAIMATALVASISHIYGFEAVVPYFFIASLAIFLTVVVFKAIRSVLFYSNTLNDMLDPEKNIYYFTVVGTVNFMGVYLSKFFHLYTTASIFWYVAISLWLGISLSTFSILFLYKKSTDRNIENIFHGGWFFITIGTQSTALLGITVAEHAVHSVIFIQLFSFTLWSIGACLYIILMAFIILRMVFYKFEKHVALSPYWMNVAAAALTALTGATLYQHVSVTGGPFMDFLPFLKGFSLFFWSFGLWWMPYLVILAIRKQAYSEEGLPFTVGYWEIVFTLGLYAVSTFSLFSLFKGHYLITFSACFSIACVVFWCFTSLFTVFHLVRSSVWIPVNDLTINYAIPYSFTLRGSVFHVKEVIKEWLDETIDGVISKRYCVVTSNNLTCQISYRILAKKWYFDQ
ncbi:MAG TPA: tellurite resistance/C4-dicarboxylate transporter family protein, partial [Candidatus Brocadiaceae bacterium]